MFGQLGQGNTDDIGGTLGTMPPPLVQIGGSAVSVAAGISHTCVLMDTKAMKCWGDARFGQVGPVEWLNSDGGIIVDRGFPRRPDDMVGDAPGEMPPPEIDLGGAAQTISSGRNHNCAVMEADKSLRCFGDNRYGQLGTGSVGSASNIGRVASAMPPPPVDLSRIDPSHGSSRQVEQIAVGKDKTCAIVRSGAVFCWGKESQNQLANAFAYTDYPGFPDPIPVIASPPMKIELAELAHMVGLGDDHVCALLASGALNCWGSNRFGQLGVNAVAELGARSTFPLPTVDVGLELHALMPPPPVPVSPPPFPPFAPGINNGSIAEWTVMANYSINPGHHWVTPGLPVATQHDAANGVAVDAMGYAYTTGSVTGADGKQQLFLQKTSPAGEARWTLQSRSDAYFPGLLANRNPGGGGAPWWATPSRWTPPPSGSPTCTSSASSPKTPPSAMWR